MTLASSILARITFCGFIAFISFAANAADVTVVVEGVNGTSGNIRVGLFASQESFPKTPTSGQSAPAQIGSVSLAFKGLTPGTYAFSAYHDGNENQKLDTNSFGMPIEPYGFSRDARGRFGPPSFDDAAIKVDKDAQTIKILLK